MQDYVDYVEFGGKFYEVIDYISVPDVCEGTPIPLIDIELMSDERWNELAMQNAIKHYIERHGVEPESGEIALEEEREFIYKLLEDDEDFKKKEAPVTDQSAQGLTTQNTY